MFSHLPELFGLLVLGLIIFGPKKMIEMGGQVGRLFRELQSAIKEMNWNPLGEESTSSLPGATPSPLSKFSQWAQDLSAIRGGSPTPAPSQHVVETTAQPTSEIPATPTPRHDSEVDA